jgi:hypothetical protein
MSDLNKLPDMDVCQRGASPDDDASLRGILFANTHTELPEEIRPSNTSRALPENDCHDIDGYDVEPELPGGERDYMCLSHRQPPSQRLTTSSPQDDLWIDAVMTPPETVTIVTNSGEIVTSNQQSHDTKTSIFSDQDYYDFDQNKTGPFQNSPVVLF